MNGKFRWKLVFYVLMFLVACFGNKNAYSNENPLKGTTSLRCSIVFDEYLTSFFPSYIDKIRGSVTRRLREEGFKLYSIPKKNSNVCELKIFIFSAPMGKLWSFTFLEKNDKEYLLNKEESPQIHLEDKTLFRKKLASSLNGHVNNILHSFLSAHQRAQSINNL